MKKELILTTLAAVIIAVLLSVGTMYYFLNPKSSRIAYVKADVLFSEFELTKELKTKFSNVESARNTILDSLLINLKMAASRNNAPAVQQLEKEYEVKKESFDRENQELTEKYNQQIWSRINQYVNDFSEKQGYEIVLGANGSGSLFYASDKLDITKEVLNYMNTKYAGTR